MRGTASLARVAAVVAVGIAAAFAAVVLLDGASGDYTVKARFQNASQLVKGNLVQVSGIRAGAVEDIRLTPDGQAELTLKIDEKYAPLRRGTQATVRQASLSGVANRYIDLRLPGARSRPIPDGGTIAQDSHDDRGRPRPDLQHARRARPARTSRRSSRARPRSTRAAASR